MLVLGYAWALGFGPIYVVAVAVAIGLGLVLLLGRAPGVTEPAREGQGRGGAEHPLLTELERSLDKKVELLCRLGFKEIDYLPEESTKGLTAFRVENPMPLSGGGFLVQFLARKPRRGVVQSPEVLGFISLIKHTDEVLKGLLITTGAFSVPAWGVLEKAPVELIDGRHVLSLFRLWFPDRFEPDRL